MFCFTSASMTIILRVIVLGLALTLPKGLDGLRLPKIFKDDMVLQSMPTHIAIIWGYAEGNTTNMDRNMDKID